MALWSSMGKDSTLSQPLSFEMGDEQDKEKDEEKQEQGRQHGFAKSKKGSDSSAESLAISTWRAEAVLLSIRDLRFSVKGPRGGNRHDILRGVSAYVKGEQVLAIMGGSGAGKTTLLNAITLQMQGGERTGSVELNGTALTHSRFTAFCAYVGQEDVLCPAFTVKETLQIASSLYLGNSQEDRRSERMVSLLTETGLETCEHIKVGDGMLIKGISGGQRRRLSVAIELLKRPVLLVLDEPTSGLDSAAAERLMSLLTRISQKNQVATICTIHQPSSYVYKNFDQLLLMAKGQTCYFGAANDALSHFGTLGFNVDPGVNPAEFLIRITNTDFCAIEQAEQIVQQWLEHARHMVHGVETHNDLSLPPGAGSPWRSQVSILFQRALLGNVRNPIAFFGRIFVSVFSVAFVSVAYLGVRTCNQTSILDRVYLVMWLQQLPAFLCVGAVSGFSREFSGFRKEVKNGLYTSGSYFVADALVNIPFWFVLSAVSILPGFAIANLNWRHFPQIWFLVSCYVGWTDTMAQLCGTLIRNITLATMVFILQTLVNMIFNGTLLAQVDEVVWLLRWMFYVVPAKYSFRSGVYLEFDGLAFNGFDKCVDPSLTLEERVSLTCWGSTGTQVVRSLQSQVFPVLSTESTLSVDVGMILGQVLILKAIHFLSLLCNSS